jgi:hypothetical protein
MSFQITGFNVFPSVLTGDYYLEWDGKGDGVFKYIVEWGPNESGPWLYAGEVIGSNGLVVKVEERKLSNLDDLWFRLIVRSGNVTVAVSTPISYTIETNRKEYLQYREMLRRWNLELEKFIGSTGYLLRVKLFGEKAKNIHPILGQPIGTEDEESHGQFYKGGYWPPVRMKVAYTERPEENTQKFTNEDMGLSEQYITRFMTMPFPTFRANDIWVSGNNNNRFIVKGVNSLDFNGLMVKQIIDISRLPVTDPVYKIKIDRSQ